MAPNPAATRPMIGVVGANGAGKSTLLRLLAGELAPVTRTIDVHASARPWLVEQQVDVLSDPVRAFAWQWDGVAERLRRRLQLDPDDLDPDDLDPDIGRGWLVLSPGQRKRWKLAAALAEQPDILLLDEPTNHLDLPSIERLEAALLRWAGALLLVTHDDHLAAATTEATWTVADGTVRRAPAATPNRSG